MANIPNPIYPLTVFDVFRTLPDLGILDPADITFEQHVQKMLAYAGSKDPDEVWSDFFKHTDGRIVLEWISGISALLQYNDLMRIREGALDTAMTANGVIENAFNKGYLLGPTVGGKIRLTLTKQGDPINVTLGQIIGNLSTYQLISAETKVLTGTTTLDLFVGYADTITQTISGVVPFQTLVFKPTGKYVAEDMESFLVATTQVDLETELSPDRGAEDDFLLRRYVNGLIKIYTGNGVLGYNDPSATTVTYNCISYDDDLSTKILEDPTLFLDLIIEQKQLVTLPAGAPSREEVRQSAVYYAPDGKLVQDPNYTSHILKHFGGILYDVVSYNTDPDQEVVLLKHPSFGASGGITEANNLATIRNSVDTRRGMGIKINYYLKEPDSGITWRPIMYIDGRYLSVDLTNRIDAFLLGRTMKMFVAAQTIRAIDLATELSAKFSVQITPDDPDETIAVPFLGFFTFFGINLQVRAS